MTQVGGSYSGEVTFFPPSMTSMCQVKEEVQTVKVTDKNKANTSIRANILAHVWCFRLLSKSPWWAEMTELAETVTPFGRDTTWWQMRRWIQPQSFWSYTSNRQLDLFSRTETTRQSLAKSRRVHRPMSGAIMSPLKVSLLNFYPQDGLSALF